MTKYSITISFDVLKYYFTGKKHRELNITQQSSISLSDFFTKSSTDSTTCTNNRPTAVSILLNTPQSSPCVPVVKSVQSFSNREDVLQAEILWALKCVNNHYSYKSCDGTTELFSSMFPDSDIAKRFSCGEKKCAYLCTFGIAPHFQDLLHKSVFNCHQYVLLFDESLNRKTQTKQMDLHIRYWDSNLGKVATRFYGSKFMGHSTAVNMIEDFRSACIRFDMKKLLQVSMDGPAVNWKFHEMLAKELRKDFENEIINIGSCGLHTTHNAFKHGCNAVDWHIQSTLSALYRLLKDSPARRDDFLKASTLKLLPLKFCTVRWLSNTPVAERVIMIWEDVKAYVKLVETKSLPKPTCKSYNIILDSTKDVLFPIKLRIFHSISKVITPFLTEYQAEKPLLPFLAEDTKELVQTLQLQYKIVKNEVFTKANTVKKVLDLNFREKNNLENPKSIYLGFVPEKMAKELSNTKQISEKQIIELKMDCREFIITVITKLLEKSPAQYSLVRNISCLDPRKMIDNTNDCIKMFQRVLNSLVTHKRVDGDACDMIQIQYYRFLQNVVPASASSFKSFFPHKEGVRLDTFFVEHMQHDKAFKDLWDVVQMILLLSHGQATVERGFSLNRQIEVENLKENSYVALRTIKEHIYFAGGIRKVLISKELKVSCSAARQKYVSYLENEKQEKKEKEVSLKRKELSKQLECINAKKKRLSIDIDELFKGADCLAEEAERSGNLSLISKSNSFRKSAKEKQSHLNELTKAGEDIFKEINC